jgi:capsular polysaccharide export protein
VHKVNFNAGDWFYFRQHAVNYRGTLEVWPAWLEAQLRLHRIEVVFLFGDCRPVHQAAHKVITRLGLDIGVFEEGYIRPDYVTLERFGVNGFSRMPRNPDAYEEDLPAPSPAQPVGNAYWAMVRCGFWYFLFACLGRVFFPHYVHHRPLAWGETIPWIRSAWRKQWYRWKERGIQDQLTSTWSGRYFLSPLQVFNDAQVTIHAAVDSVDDFIRNTLHSFSAHAPSDSLLVFKHHPMDRGYRSYSALIRRVAKEAGLERRVLYLHDQHLPTLLDHTCGVVVVNSTVGLSALHHQAPTVVCGKAIYDMPGLTFQGTLDQFWRSAEKHKPNKVLYRRFRARLIAETQVNGSFYRSLPGKNAFAGLNWAVARPRRVPPHPSAFIEDEEAMSHRASV